MALPAGTQRLVWRVIQDSAVNENIRFRVMEDRSGKGDAQVVEGRIGNGSPSGIEIQHIRSLYIADPDGAAGRQFLVEVYPG